MKECQNSLLTVGKFNCTIINCKPIKQRKNKMITSDDLELARQAINNMATAFEDLVQVCKNLDKSDQRRIFSPDTFGPISQFLGIGNGYEAACPGSQFVPSETLLGMLEDEIIYDEDDEEELTDDDELEYELTRDTDF